MRILITNDDGYNADGILTLINWAKKLGEVTIVAPKYEQSGKSHGIELHKAFEVKKVNHSSGVECFTVDSTPADCVRFAVNGLGQNYDLILSGINRGFNIGLDIIYSGTCGALFEASAFGLKALAFSTDTSSFIPASEQLDSVYNFILDNSLFNYNDIYNINIPLEVKGTRITRQGGAYFKDNFVSGGDDMYIADGYSVYKNTGDLNIDTDAVMNGYISISPLTLDRTNKEAFGVLSKLNN